MVITNFYMTQIRLVWTCSEAVLVLPKNRGRTGCEWTSKLRYLEDPSRRSISSSVINVESGQAKGSQFVVLLVRVRVNDVSES